MGILSELVAIVSTGGADLWVKFAKFAIPLAAAVLTLSAAFLYVHEKDAALARAQAALARSEQALAATTAANTENVKTIDLLRFQQAQAEAARAAMDLRDQIAQNGAAAIRSMIDREALSCPNMPAVAVASPPSPGKDGPMAPVLRDTLSAMAAAQTAEQVSP